MEMVQISYSSRRIVSAFIVFKPTLRGFIYAGILQRNIRLGIYDSVFDEAEALMGSKL